MKNRIKAPATVTIAVLTAITVIFWVGFEVFRLATKKPEVVVPAEIILPLSPTLDSDALSKLQKRVYLNEGEIGNINITVQIQATPEPVSVSTNSAELNVNNAEESTNSGQITSP